MPKAYVNPEMLRWAMERSNGDMSDVAGRLGTSTEKMESWISGDDAPTFKQAQRLATLLQVPFGYFYLEVPPREQIPIAEFRKIPGILENINRDILDLLLDIDFKRDWYREYRVQEGFEKLDFISRFDIDSPNILVSSDIRRELSRASNSLFLTRKQPERFLEEMIRAAEKLGIWVMRSGVIGNNTHRPIAVETLRGFAIADDIAPIIFLNGKDSKSAQIFTFAHELAHLWLGQSSLEFGELSEIVSNGDHRVETKCNAIAAEVLVPSNEFAVRWNRGASLDEQASALSQEFSVSRVVIARRALEQGYIDSEIYRSFFALEKRRWASLAKSAGGGSYYNNIPSRNGKAFTKTVAREAAIGRLMYREAGQLLGVQPSKVRELHERTAD